jgi:DNA-binding XRE family transcriptional regulator
MKKTFEQVNEGIMNVIAKLKEPGGMTKANQLSFLWEFAKLTTLDERSKDTIKLKKALGEYMKHRRLDKGLSLRDVGGRLHLNHQTIVNIENGNAKISIYPYAFMMMEAYIVELTSEEKGFEQKETATV